jgi:hypothetical protein
MSKLAGKSQNQYLERKIFIFLPVGTFLLVIRATRAEKYHFISVARNRTCTGRCGDSERT